jgi:prolyl oligopeptidase
MRRLLLALLASTSLMTTAAQAADPADPANTNGEARTPLADLGKDDPYKWMEEIEGERPLAWAKAQNTRSLAVLQGDSRYAGLENQALAILNAKDRVPGVSFAGDGSLRNFWQDADHVRGVWRKTTLESYRTAEPQWETILDIDALSKAENANWVFKGAGCLPPEETRCLVSLSNGGKDAVTIREFDTTTRTFVEDGFVLPEGKQNVSWLDKDTLLVAREWEPGQVTKSGYAYVIKAWKRGTPLASAKEVFLGTRDDVSASAYTLNEADGQVAATLIHRGVSFFEAETYLLTDQRAGEAALPAQALGPGLCRRPDGDVAGAGLAREGLQDRRPAQPGPGALKADPAKALARPGPASHPQAVGRDRHHHPRQAGGRPAGQRHRRGPGLQPRAQGLDVPEAGPAGQFDDRPGLGLAEGRPPVPQRHRLSDALDLLAGRRGLAEAGAGQGLARPLRRLDPRGRAVRGDQHRRVKIPYFVVRPKGVKYDGSAPTLLYAYGGFQASMTPAYSGVMGKLWLERGGTYVVANIRGGGEFGPAWHNAGLKENRQKVYDDFFAVSQDLIDRKITSPRRLGIMGGSNGGLLMGVALTQRPELYNAIVVQVPLFDMIRYTQIGAGASWVGEYGDPAIPSERAVIAKYDPYSNLKAGRKYPEVFIETSTKDDRVHPAHARKAAARLEELGYPVLYYENIDGGHAASANLAETARRQALEYVYLSKKLMD